MGEWKGYEGDFPQGGRGVRGRGCELLAHQPHFLNLAGCENFRQEDPGASSKSRQETAQMGWMKSLPDALVKPWDLLACDERITEPHM